PAIWQRFDNPKIRPQLDTACTDAFEAKAPWELAGAAASFDFVLKDATGLDAGEAVGSLFFRVLAKSVLDALPPAADLATRLKAAISEQAPPDQAAAPSPQATASSRPAAAVSPPAGRVATTAR